MIQKILLPCLLLLLVQAMSAQTVTLRGAVTDAETEKPLSDAAIVITGSGKIAATGNDGSFTLPDVDCITCTLSVTHEGYEPVTLEIKGSDATQPIRVTLRRIPEINNLISDIPTITLDEAQSQSEGAGEVANLLSASRDVFQTVSGFGWSPFRFRERGYDSEFFPLYLNGVNINDPETGFTVFGEIGGLNDVLRNRTSSVGLASAEFAFTEIGGATLLDTRASVQRKQIRASYAVSNRLYTNRVMLTASTGLMPGGWAVTLSGSRRWSQEGYFDGTFFDGYSYFLSVDKKIGTQHILNLTFLGAPSTRGKQADSFDEMFDLAGTHRYNPNWGYQNGDKRNAALGHSHQPIGILRYDWTPSTETAVTASVYGQAGERGDTRMEWNDAGNPAPDYNRRLPSSLTNPDLAAQWADSLRSNESLRQIDWHNFYDVNSRNFETISDADGIAGNTVSGNRAQYIIEDQRADSRELGVNIFLNQTLSVRSKLQAGINYRWYNGENFKTVYDLLGADYWYDINKFASQDFPGEPDKEQNDLLNPNNVVREGEIFGYNYDENIRQGGSWIQFQTDLKRLSFFFGGELGLNTFWRTGKMQNGRFPDNSLGDSEKQSFYTYGARGGVTYKLDGRNYLYANGFIGTKPPQFFDIYLSPRSRDEVVPGVDPYTVRSVEGGYMLRAPNFRARLTGYLTDFINEVEADRYFYPAVGEFATIIRTGVDHRHTGIEAAFEVKPVPSWVFTGATNLGHYFYTSRPLMYFTADNTGAVIFEDVTIYQENFLVPRTPQTTASASVKYEGKQFWFASLTFNWRDDFWYDFDPLRRTAEAVLGLEPESPIWNTIVDQQKAPSAYTLDFFGGKSWKFGKYFVYLNVGINNILNNEDIIVSGRDAWRNAFGRELDNELLYTTEVMYAPGLNYFISLTLRM